MPRKKLSQIIEDIESELSGDSDFGDDFYDLLPRGYGILDYDFDDDDPDEECGVNSGPPADLPITIRDTIAESSLPPERNIKNRIMEIQKALGSVGDFCCGGKLSADYLVPAIEILKEGTDGDYKPLPLPIVYEEQYKDLIKNCSKSPFGRGEETVYDDNVRKSWQLDPQKFRITNPRWNGLIEELVNNTVKVELGIAKEKKIDFSLYKMLLYEEGGFFDFHRDTEKEDGMIATLVVQLPSSFTGGSIVVRHSDKEKRFECHNEATYSPYYVSFYCDCLHKVERVTSGYRLALIYNLKYTGSDKITYVDSANHLKELQNIIDTWIKAPMHSKLCYILEHKYSTAGLNPSLLKGKDEIAFKLFTQLEHTIVSLAILEKHETSSGCTIQDIEDTQLNYKARMIGDKHKGVISLFEDEIFPHETRRAMPVTSQDIETTGNEGATIERLYQSACIVFYPKQFKSLCEDDFNNRRLVVLLEEYKNKHTDKRKHLLMALTSSLLCCSEDSRGNTTYGLDIPKISESCLLLNYLPLSMKFVERLWIADGFERTLSIQEAVKIIKHHGVGHFKVLFDKHINNCFKRSYYYSSEIEGVSKLLMELNEASWLDTFIEKLESISSKLFRENLESSTIISLLNFTEQFPSHSGKISSLLEKYVEKELEKSNRYSTFSAELIVKLNKVELCSSLFQSTFKGYINTTKMEQLLMLMKHFGIEKTLPMLIQSLEDKDLSSTSTIDVLENLLTKDSAEEKVMSSKLLEAMAKPFSLYLPNAIRLLTICRKNNRISDEINLAKSLISNQKVSTPSVMYELVRGIIKENGTDCFWTGSGFRLLLENCYKLLYNAASSSSDSLDLDFGENDSNNTRWVFNHIKVSCSCDHCTKVKKFLQSNEKQLALKEKLDARKHVEKILKGEVDIQRETIKIGSPQTLKLTKTMKSAEAKKSIVVHIETILKQFIEYATVSDQKPHARPAEQSSSTDLPPTKKVKQE